MKFRSFAAGALLLLGATPCDAAATPSSGAGDRSPRSPDRSRVESRLIVRLRTPPPAAPQSLTVGQSGLAAFDRACLELGVDSVRPLSRAPASAHRDAAQFAALGLDRVVRLEVAPARREAVADALRRCSDVTDVVAAAGAIAAKLPNDPSWNSQWSLQNGVLDMPKAWNRLTDATGVPVAVIDSGSDLIHSDFRANRWINAGEIAGNGTDDDGNGYIDDRYGYDFVNDDGDPADDNGHGTNVAGVIAAVGDNAVHVCGVCWKAEVITCKALDAAAFGTFDELAEGVTYAADNGARVVNMSFVADIDDPVLRSAVDYARSLDVVQVAAAGNDGTTAVLYPAAYDGVLGVIATDSADQRWSNSSHGSWCDLAAPGVGILTLRKGGGTLTATGTSLAAPHVAGVCALVRKQEPMLDRVAVEIVVSQSAEDLGAAGFDDEFGHGRLNGHLALDRASRLRTSVPEIQDGGAFTLDLSVPDEPGDLYFLFPSFSDRLPGIPLSVYDPADPRLFPLNEDWLFDYVAQFPTNPYFTAFTGTLDANGLASAAVDLPKKAFDGMPLDFAFVTIDPADLSKIISIGGPVRVWVR